MGLLDGSDSKSNKFAQNNTLRFALNFLAFFIKIIFAFLLSVLIANSYSQIDFVKWSIFFSISMIVSTSDLGVGQLVLTSLNNAREENEKILNILSQGFNTLLFLSILAFLIGFFLLKIVGFTFFMSLLLSGIISIRIPFILYSAYLQFCDRIHERRLVEAASFLVGTLTAFFLVEANATINTILISINIIFSAFCLIFYYRSYQLGIPKLSWKQEYRIRGFILLAAPYFINNVTGLITYGGFIFFLSLVLYPEQIAFLSIFHAVIFGLGYQFFEYLFRFFQLTINKRRIYQNMLIVLITFFIAALFGASLIGKSLLELLYKNYTFETYTILYFIFYSFLEYFFQLGNIRIQMNYFLKRTLISISLIRISVFILICFCLNLFKLKNLDFIILLLSLGPIIGILCNGIFLYRNNDRNIYDY